MADPSPPLPARLPRPARLRRPPPPALLAETASRTTDLDLVWCQPTGRPIDPHADWKEWQSILKAAGIRPTRVHDIRHTTGTMLIEEGADLRVVQDVLGHSSSKMTERYTHVTDRGRKEAGEALARALWGN